MEVYNVILDQSGTESITVLGVYESEELAREAVVEYMREEWYHDNFEELEQYLNEECNTYVNIVPMVVNELTDWSN